MTRFLFVLFIIFFLGQGYAHEGHDHDHDHEEPANSDVVVLGQDNFDESIKNNEFVFVEFYAPWCGHCKHLAPEYEKVATALKTEGSSVVVAKVDATVHSELGQRFGVRGYPTLKFFRSGSPIDYEGQRTADDITKYIKRKSGPASTLLESSDAVDKFKTGKGTKIIAFVTEEQTSIWLDVGKSSQVEDFALGHVSDSSLFGEYKASEVVIFKEGETIKYSGEFTKTPILTWISAEGHPLVDELAQKSWMRSSSSGTPLLALFSTNSDELNSIAIDLGKKYKGKVIVTSSATTNLAERWGSSGKKFPTAILVQWDGENPKFVIFDEDTEELNGATADNFVEKALSGEYKSYRKSEPIPEKNDDPVKVVVGKTFDSIVYDKTKDVFVEFYAPWCGHCKKLVPIWDELGTAFKDSSSVVIAKIDATANSVPQELQIRGYPTLIFFPADNKAGVPFEGERDLSGLKKFVTNHASVGNKNEL